MAIFNMIGGGTSNCIKEITLPQISPSAMTLTIDIGITVDNFISAMTDSFYNSTILYAMIIIKKSPTNTSLKVDLIKSNEDRSFSVDAKIEGTKLIITAYSNFNLSNFSERKMYILHK